MTEKRFFKIIYDYDWWFVFDKKQEYIETECPVPHKKASDLIPMEEEQVVELLNENEQLKKEKQELEEELDCIWDSYEKYYGMSIRNTEWYGFKGD